MDYFPKKNKPGNIPGFVSYKFYIMIIHLP